MGKEVEKIRNKKTNRNFLLTISILIIIAALILVISLNKEKKKMSDSLSKLNISDMEIIEEFNVSGIKEIVFADKDLIGFNNDHTLLKISKDNGEIIESCHMPNLDIADFTFANGKLFAYSAGDVINVDYNFCFRKGECSVNSSCIKEIWKPQPTGEIGGMVNVNGKFYFYVHKSADPYNKIIEFYPNKSIKREDSVTRGFPADIEWDGNTFWLLDWDCVGCYEMMGIDCHPHCFFKLSRYSYDLKQLYTSKEFINPWLRSPMSLATDGDSLFVSDSQNSKIYKIDYPN